MNRKSLYHICICYIMDFSFEPAFSRASTASRKIAAHLRWSWAKSHEMLSQLRFHRRRPTTWGPDSAARSFLIALATSSAAHRHVSPLRKRRGRSTLLMSSPSGCRSLNASVENLRQTGRIFRVGLGTFPSIKSQSTFLNEQHIQRWHYGARYAS